MNQLAGAVLLIIGLMFLSGWLVLPWTMDQNAKGGGEK